MAAFSQFESDLDAKTKAQLEKGKRVVEMFKQPAYSPIAVEVQTAVMWAMQNGFFEDIAVEHITAATKSLIVYFESQGDAVITKIYNEKKLTEVIEEDLKNASADWKRAFSV